MTFTTSILPCACALLLALVLGCAHSPDAPRSPLSPVAMFPDSVVLELTSVRFPLGRADLNDELWAAIDEQKLLPAARRSLDEQGIRAGVLSGYLPRALEQELAQQRSPTASESGTVVSFEQDSTITTRHVQTRRSKRVEVVTAGPYARLPILEVGASGQVEGRDYPDAECRLVIRAWPRSDGHVRLELTPELQYGQARPRLAAHPEMGMVFFEPGRDRKLFPHLSVEVTLAPGEMLVLSGQPDRPGSLGYHFFTGDDTHGGTQEQKLLLVRLSQTQQDGIFSEAELLDGEPAGGEGAVDDRPTSGEAADRLPEAELPDSELPDADQPDADRSLEELPSGELPAGRGRQSDLPAEGAGDEPRPPAAEHRDVQESW